MLPVELLPLSLPLESLLPESLLPESLLPESLESLLPESVPVVASPVDPLVSFTPPLLLPSSPPVLLSSGGPLVSALLSLLDNVLPCVVADVPLSSAPPVLCPLLSFWAVVTDVPSMPMHPVAPTSAHPTNQRMPTA